MNTSTIRKKLSEYIKVADDKKVKAIYTIVEREINEMNQWWNDKDLVEELNTRSADLKSGKDEGIGWEPYPDSDPREQDFGQIDKWTNVHFDRS